MVSDNFIVQHFMFSIHLFENSTFVNTEVPIAFHFSNYRSIHQHFLLDLLVRGSILVAVNVIALVYFGYFRAMSELLARAVLGAGAVRSALL